MKKVLIALIMLVSFSTYGMAQNSYTEVVYLKNGSIIRGVVVEQVPNVSLKIKTADGSIFAYPMAEVEKITKEENTAINSYRYKKQVKNTLRGYKGFVDAGYLFDVSDNDANKFEIATSHGYQFNNYFFVGGGLAVDYYTDLELTSVPVFANFRANFINNKVTPFGDVKLGYTAGDIEGVYFSLAVGARVALAKKMALNFRLELAAQGWDYEEYYSYSYGGNYGSSRYDEYTTLSNIGLKVGFEF